MKTLTVELNDGVIINEDTAIKTYLETLNRIGLVNIQNVQQQLNLGTKKNPIISDTKLNNYYKLSNNKYVFTFLNNKNKVENLKILQSEFDIIKNINLTEIDKPKHEHKKFLVDFSKKYVNMLQFAGRNDRLQINETAKDYISITGHEKSILLYLFKERNNNNISVKFWYKTNPIKNKILSLLEDNNIKSKFNLKEKSIFFTSNSKSIDDHSEVIKNIHCIRFNINVEDEAHYIKKTTPESILGELILKHKDEPKTVKGLIDRFSKSPKDFEFYVNLFN